MEEQKIMVTIKVKSPLHLSSGRADVNVDADIAHDKLGLPYFPARRFKGLLYESALEAAEMMELSGLNIITKEKVEELFGHKINSSVVLSINNFRLPDYEEISREWNQLQLEFKDLIIPEDVLECYTSLRSQTALEDDGTAKTGSLRTMRTLDSDGLEFVGEIVLRGEAEYKTVLALALQNLTSAGGRRNRGFGRIECSMEGQEELLNSCFSEVY